MTPKEAIERLKHWPEMTELEKLHFQASGNLTPADGELWEVWREFFC